MGEFKGEFAPFVVLAFFLSFNILLLVHGQLLPIVSDHGENISQIKTYIVHVLKPEGSNFLGAEDLENWHKSFLPNTTLDTGEPRLLFSYKEAISGFAARLTPEEVRDMEKMDGFLRANPSKALHLQTTYTHDFLNLSTSFGVWSTSNSFYGEGIIIGVLDTGIYMPHPSFDDTGMPPRPAGWNVSCYLQTPCNDKVIGGIDKAIQDGVHILQMSFGLPPLYLPISLDEDDVAIATYSAMHKGIFPCTAAGNSGPDPETLSHAAPWDMVIGATTTDRRISRATVTLGNGTQFHGESAYQPNMVTDKFLPLVFPGSNGRFRQLYCLNNSLNGIDVRDKIVMCDVGNLDNIEKIILFQTLHPTAKDHLGGTIFDIRPSPALAYFSSRGLVRYNGNNVKLDVTAPGVNILSAWPVEVGLFLSGLKIKPFNFESGTSMATPHVSGIVALIMSKLKNDNKRQWSTSEIQSALITTTDTFDLDGKPIYDEATLSGSANILQRGAGQVNVMNAMDPGLALQH
ncbi:subtilisin-like protease 4 [Dioscorea cayenensis subsp. rotundata]|uniref:Subtilisin-like protease 4 n=1 Tax=Dioscorea cayennensis subsp. rotundata TaxID=55577 RepID=A0AB40B0D0_DIOCR|nr:subtilisin-like protease 4 [Dioscorea cayenensis subsp. rotundata]